jgi:hypothetical protein
LKEGTEEGRGEEIGVDGVKGIIIIDQATTKNLPYA